MQWRRCKVITRDFLMNADCKTAFGAIEESLLWSAEQRAASLAATLGFISAIGAIGGFFIPKAFGSSLALTGSPVGAMKVFLIFYIACVVITWAVYGRHSKK